MIEKNHKNRFRPGITLVESMVAAVVILVAILGTSSFRYHAALQARRAAAKTAAARVALILGESWRGLNGDDTYDPQALENLELDITADQTNAPDTPADFTLLGNYAVALDEDDGSITNYYTTLSYKDVQTGLRALNVVIAWDQRDPDKEQGAESPDKEFNLTFYAQTL